MTKRVLVVCLCVCIVASTGCAELNRLRKQNAGLQQQLAAAKDSENKAIRERDSILGARGKLQTDYDAALARSTQLDQLVAELQRAQVQLDAQNKELQAMLGDIAKVEQRDGSNVIVMKSDILFESGKADLSGTAKQSLTKVAQYLVEHPDLPVRIDGHTDAVPIRVSGWKDNYHLAVVRAHAVMSYLVDQGVSAERVYICGFGPNQPRVQPETPQAPTAENRRVEIFLVPPANRSPSEILKSFLH